MLDIISLINYCSTTQSKKLLSLLNYLNVCFIANELFDYEKEICFVLSYPESVVKVTAYIVDKLEWN